MQIRNLNRTPVNLETALSLVARRRYIVQNVTGGIVRLSDNTPQPASASQGYTLGQLGEQEIESDGASGFLWAWAPNGKGTVVVIETVA